MSGAIKLLLILTGILIGSAFVLINFSPAGGGSEGMSGTNKLSPAEERVIVHKGTEAPFTGEYVNHHEEGTYTCKRCGAPLFPSTAKFDSRTGWPSFDEALPGAIKEVPEKNDSRTEIVCANCGAHLGHVFKGEGFTDKNTRHCVNSVSLCFVAAGDEAPATPDAAPAPATAYFAGGCFWGVEYYLQQQPGVSAVVSGYMGGAKDNPSYKEVCRGDTGHAETVRVTYDPSLVSYEELAKLFFEIHDPTQVNRQGPDVGPQYRSAIFYNNDEEKRIAAKLIGQLQAKGLRVATQLVRAGTFWEAEDYHQDYYFKTGKTPYCHARVQRFE